MKERPILMNAPMVRATLDGSKTQTRRIAKLPELRTKRGEWVPIELGGPGIRDARGLPVPPHIAIAHSETGVCIACPHGQPGDRLWVRETWQAWQRTSTEYDEWEALTREERSGIGWGKWFELHGQPDSIEYRATSESYGPWTPSIHMPRWASRITLEVTEVRVERLQSISECDAITEGVGRDVPRLNVDTGCHDFSTHWKNYDESDPSDTYCVWAKDSFRSLWESINGAGSWASNPWVWAISFRRIR